MTSSTNYQCILRYMPDELRNVMMRVNEAEIEKISEIRLYSGRGIAFISPHKISFLDRNGNIQRRYSADSVKISSISVKSVVDKLCKNSFYCHSRELSEGYFVLENGIRVGVSGSYSNGQGQTLQEFSSLNFRLPRQSIGCGQSIYNKLSGQSILICGSVNSGKTTVLRDICRLYGNEGKCTLIDERNEISAMNNGIPTNDIGLLTDVISGRNRHDSIISAVRTLSPEYIFCDEIANDDDADAILCGNGSGVHFVATIHASEYNALMKRSVMKKLSSENVFDSAFFLYGSENPTAVREIRSLRNGS